jgi:hypothetical protein
MQLFKKKSIECELEENYLKKQIEFLQTEIKELSQVRSIKATIDKLTGGQIEWYDYFKLTKEQQRTYYKEAQSALENKAIKNEINKIISEFANWCLTKSNDFKDTEALRYQISGMKLLIERLEDIPNPDIESKIVEDPYNAI